MRSTVYCVDAGIVFRYLTPGYPEVPVLWREFRRSGAQLVAPLLLRHEVTNAFHRHGQAASMSEEDVGQHLARAFALPIDYHDDVSLSVEAARIAALHGLPATYDAHYLALAARLGVDLYTTDGKLAKAVGDRLPWVRLVR